MNFSVMTERAISFGSGLIGSAVMFLVLYKHDPSQLTTAKLFATVDLLNFLRVYFIMFAGVGI